MKHYSFALTHRNFSEFSKSQKIIEACIRVNLKMCLLSLTWRLNDVEWLRYSLAT